MSPINTPWLADWRKYADETDMNPKARRTVTEAIRQAEQSWVQKHTEAYHDQAQRRFSTRDEKIVGACDEMSKRLAEIRRDVRAGRMSAKDASAEVRSMRGRYQQAMELHDTLVEQEDSLRAFAEMTPDDYQREVINKFPVLKTVEPTLAGVVEQMTTMPSGGGSLQPIEGPGFARSAPSADDLTE